MSVACVRFVLALLGSLALIGPSPAAEAPPVRVAVAANFQLTMKRLAEEFARQNGGLAPVISSGATGLLYSQIVQGAPFDLFFAADRDRPVRLEAERLIVPGSRYTYAVGKLVAWRPGQPWSGALADVLAAPGTRTVVIANPSVAPYGAAAQQVLARLGFGSNPRFRLVQGESLGQAFQFLASRNADVGFIALSQVVEARQAGTADIAPETHEVDPSLYAPIEQDAVLLARSTRTPAAERFYRFVRSAAGRAVIAEAGYATPP